MSEDSLVATRARRANAGSRLKRLIELEEQNIEERQSLVYTEEDENVNLLFQEDENDEEFEESGEEEEDEEDDDNEDDDDNGEQHNGIDGAHGVDSPSQDSDTASKKRSIDNVDADDQLSDSDISATDSDQSEGEKELDKEEKLKKKKLKKKTSLIPTIKKPSVKKEVKKQKTEFTAKSLLNAKRASSRSAVVESKQALAKRLKADEERRALLKPVVRPVEVEMTQEERLAEAVETEKANVISLNEFREQEIVKKETQRQMLMLKRVKLVNVIRTVSEEHFVTPFDEITEARRLFEKENSKLKRKPGRKKKNAEEVVQQPPVQRPPGSIDLDLPLVKEEMERERKAKEEQELKEKEEAEAREKVKLENGEKESGEIQDGERTETADGQVEIKEGGGHESDSKDAEQEAHSEEPELDANIKGSEQDKEVSEKEAELVTDQPEVTVEDTRPGDEIVQEKEAEGKTETEESKDDNESTRASPDLVEHTVQVESPNNTAGIVIEKDINEEEAKKGKGSDILEDSTENSVGSKDIEHAGKVQDDDKMEVDDEKIELNSGKMEVDEIKVEVDEVKVEGEENNETKNEVTNNEQTEQSAEETTGVSKIEDEVSSDKTEKRVTFVGDLVDEDVKKSSATPEIESEQPDEGEEVKPEVEEEVFEGPAERVSRNMIYLVDFDDAKEHKLIESNIKTLLFGKQSLLPASRRFKDLKQIAKIGESENPYLTIIHRKDELFEPVTNLTENDSLFEDLKRLPRFGDFEDFVEEEEVNDEEVTSEIVLKTEAPTSLYLPNGNKKNCLITGTEVKYFDPANGIPYSSVETYRLLKLIEQGNVPWYSFGSDANDGGGAELYLGMREGARHAKGVPEGFDG